MKTKINSTIKWKAWVIWPLLVAVLFASLIVVLVNANAGFSVLLGAVSLTLPQAAFGYCCFRYTGALNGRHIWKSFVRGEALKLMLSAVLCGLCFRFLKVEPLWFMLAFIGMQLMQQIINCRLFNR